MNQVDLAAVDDHGETVVHLAIRGGSVEWCEVLALFFNQACLCINIPSDISHRSVLYLLSLLDFMGGSAGSETAGNWSHDVAD